MTPLPGSESIEEHIEQEIAAIKRYEVCCHYRAGWTPYIKGSVLTIWLHS